MGAYILLGTDQEPRVIDLNAWGVSGVLWVWT